MAAYPNRQNIFIFLLCALAVGGFAAYVHGFSLWNPPAVETKIMAKNLASDQTFTPDIDWQKQFLSATSSDSFKVVGKTTNSVPEEKLTATDLLGRAFMTKYAELRQTGLNGDQGSVSNVMGQVTAQSLASLPSPKSYSIKSLSVIADSKATTKAYGDVVTVAFQNYMPKQNEAEVANQAFTDNNMNLLKDIDPIIANYKKLLSILAATPVPASLSQNHINLMNGVSMAEYNAESFRHMDTDPLRGLAAVSLELVAIQNIVSALNKIK